MVENGPRGSDTVSVVASRILGSVGRFLITSGIVVLLFVGRVMRPRVGLFAAAATITGFLWIQKARQGDFDIVIVV